MVIYLAYYKLRNIDISILQPIYLKVSIFNIDLKHSLLLNFEQNIFEVIYMKWCVDEEKENNNRSHQDNFEVWDNGSYQYCEFCGRNKRFEYDRCEDCKSN